MKLLRAFIEAQGYAIEEVNIYDASGLTALGSIVGIDYKVTKKSLVGTAIDDMFHATPDHVAKDLFKTCLAKFERDKVNKKDTTNKINEYICLSDGGDHKDGLNTCGADYGLCVKCNKSIIHDGNRWYLNEKD